MPLTRSHYGEESQEEQTSIPSLLIRDFFLKMHSGISFKKPFIHRHRGGSREPGSLPSESLCLCTSFIGHMYFFSYKNEFLCILPLKVGDGELRRLRPGCKRADPAPLAPGRPCLAGGWRRAERRPGLPFAPGRCWKRTAGTPREVRKRFFWRPWRSLSMERPKYKIQPL